MKSPSGREGRGEARPASQERGGRTLAGTARGRRPRRGEGGRAHRPENFPDPAGAQEAQDIEVI